MLKKMFKIPALLAAMMLALVGSLTACGGGSSSSVSDDCTPKHSDIQTIADGKITVGVIDLPPYSSYNSGDPEGIDVDIVKKFAEENCLEPDWQQSTYSDMVQAIAGNTLDIAIGCIDRTEARMEAVDFSASNYLDAMGLASKSGADTVAKMSALDKVGTVDGYLWVDDMRKILSSKLKLYPSTVEMSQDYKAGRIDMAVDNYGVMWYAFKDDKNTKVELMEKTDKIKATVASPQTSFPLTKGNKSLNEALSDSITRMREAGDIKKLMTDVGLDSKLAGTDEYMKKVYIVPKS